MCKGIVAIAHTSNTYYLVFLYLLLAFSLLKNTIFIRRFETSAELNYPLLASSVCVSYFRLILLYALFSFVYASINSLRLLMKSPELDRTWAKLGQCVLLILDLVDLSGGLAGGGATGSTVTTLQGFKGTGVGGIGKDKTGKGGVDWWGKLKALSGFAVGRSSSSHSSSSKKNEKAERFVAQLMEFALPFDSSHQLAYSHSKGGDATAPNFKTIPESNIDKVLELFQEVETVMGRHDYFAKLKSLKMKAGQFIHHRVLEALKGLFMWVCAVLDDSALLRDKKRASDLLDLNNSPTSPDFQVDDRSRFRAKNSITELTNYVKLSMCLDHELRLQSVLSLILPRTLPDNYAETALSTLLAHPFMSPHSRTISTSRTESRHCIGRVSSLLSSLSEVVHESVLSGCMRPDHPVVHFLGSSSSSFTTERRTRYRAIRYGIDPRATAEAVALLLIENCKDLRMDADIYKWDSCGRSPLLSLCFLQVGIEH